MSLSARWQVSWGQRILGLVVLLTCVAALVGLLSTGGAPRWTWAIVGLFGGASLVATIANFGSAYHVDDEGLWHENALTARLGWPRERRVAWSEIRAAVDHEGSTWFLEIAGQSRFVLDHIDGHEHLGLLLADRGISVRKSQRPRIFARGSRDAGNVPGSPLR